MKVIDLGIQICKQQKVEARHSAMVYGSGLIDVFSTPAMIAFMEQTCNELILSYLDDGEVSVGVEVSVKHLKATPIGDTVKCIAEVIEVFKNKVTFKVETFDSKGKIGEGTHKRAIVPKEVILNNL
ncbi:MAG: thioesterase family protein [Bacteroidales bacterium]|nr:thioesterase family protein [Bacteroidales bacterium]